MLHLRPYFSALLLCLAAFPALATSETATIIDSGNTTWLLLCSALVMLMTPGLAFFYAGMVSRKNVVSTLLQNYVALAMVGLIWIIIGYSLAFSEGNQWIGGTTLIMLRGLTTQVYAAAQVPHLAFMAFQMMFAIITPALMTGSIAERVNFGAWMLLLALWSMFVYVPVAHWVWGPGGWIATMGGLDFAGGLVVHVTAGFGGLIAAIMFGKRISHHLPTPPNNVPMIMLGAALLWFGWFGFNAGSALTAGALASHAFVLTFIGGAAAFLSWMLVDWIRTGKPSAVGAATGLVVGLVTITPAAGFVSIEAGMLMCTITGVVCNMFAHYIKAKTHLDDSLDVFACHGTGAVLGSIMTGMFASSAVNPAVTVQGLMITGETKLFVANLVGTVAVASYAFVVTYVLIKLISYLMPIRVSGDMEDVGLDASLHGETAHWRGDEARTSA
ncbi:MAG: ammonium transporter [Rickettsiales bacterium]|nr:ammonium transporter [Rickettsiales bacterium]